MEEKCCPTFTAEVEVVKPRGVTDRDSSSRTVLKSTMPYGWSSLPLCVSIFGLYGSGVMEMVNEFPVNWTPPYATNNLYKKDQAWFVSAVVYIYTLGNLVAA